LPLPLLRAHLQQGKNTAEVVQAAGLSGRKALVQRWRQETQQALAELDPAACERWRQGI